MTRSRPASDQYEGIPSMQEVDKKIDGDALRAVMRRVPSPVTVVTARGEEEMRGITIGSFASTSLDPPLVSFNVEREAQMHDLLATADHYAVHILGDEHAALSDRFALPDRTGPQQFEGVAYHVDDRGTPVLEGTLAVLFCIPYAVYDAGDHSIFVGEVVDIRDGAAGTPILYYNRAYRSVGREVTSSRLSPVKRASSDTP